MARVVAVNDGRSKRRPPMMPVAAAASPAHLCDLNRPPRIVLIDDESFMVEAVGMMLAMHLPQAKLLAFRNRDTGWQELLRTDPDLLITDMNNHNVPGRTESLGMSGWDLLPLLTQRAVGYPILVVSGSFSLPGFEDRARALAGPNLNITFMTKPFEVEFFQLEVKRLLSGGGMKGKSES